MKETNLIAELIEIQNLVPLSFSLYIKGNRYQLKDIKISKKSTPLTKRALRGGVYISDKFVCQITATIFHVMDIFGVGQVGEELGRFLMRK